MRRKLSYLAVSALLLVVAASAAEAQTKLRWKFKPDEQIHYEMKMDMAQEMLVREMKIGTKMSQVMNMTWAAKEVAEDGTTVLSQTIDRVRVNITPMMPGQEPISFDSESETVEKNAEMLAPLFKSMVGAPILITVTPLGEIKNIELSPEMAKVLKGTAEIPLGAMFSEDSFKQMMARSMFSFPNEVAKDQAWETTTEIPNPILGKQIVVAKYRYLGPEEREGHKLEKIDTGLEMKFESGPDAKAEVKIGDQSSSGAIYFDNVAGHPTETNLTSKMTMEIEVGGMAFEQHITTSVQLKEMTPEKK